MIGQNSPFGPAQLTLQQYTGFCPLCAYVAPTFRPAGTLTRSFTSLATGRTSVDATFLAPLSGRWTSDNDVVRIARSLSCN